jgi:PKD repeat protein
MVTRVCACMVLLGAVACGSGNSSTAPTPTQANITVTISPNPVTATACSPTCQGANALFLFRADGTLTIQETAGIGGTVNSITAIHGTSSIVSSAADIIQRSGTNRVPARGTLIFPLFVFNVLVDFPNSPRQVVVPYVVQFTDDRGNQLTATVQWSLN